jgi:general secretion pathway protein M
MPPLLRRIAAIMLFLAMLSIAWSLMIAPVMTGIAEDYETIAESRQLLARYERVAAGLPKLEQRVMEIRTSDGLKGLLVGTNPTLASAKLQTDVQQLTAAAGINLRTSQTLPPQDEGGFRRVGFRLELQTDAAGLLRLLYTIETATPSLFIDNLSIRVPESGPHAPEGDSPSLLAVQLQVFGYLAGALR